MTTGTATTGSAGDSINYNPDNFTQWPEGPYYGAHYADSSGGYNIGTSSTTGQQIQSYYDVYNGKTAWTTSANETGADYDKLDTSNYPYANGILTTLPTSTTYAGVTPKGNGQYAEVYLGEAFFDINVNSLPTSGTSSSTINIDPVSNANVGLPTTYWIEGGTTHKWQGSSDGSAAMENSSPLSISYVVPATSSGSGIISLSATSATARILASTGTDVVNYAVSNSAGAGASLTAGTAAFTAGGNGSFSPSTTNATGSAAAGNTLFSGSTTYTAGATLGPQNLTISGTGYDGTNTTTATTTVSTDIVAARALTAGTVAMPALLTNGSYTVSLAITGAAGADTSYTRPTASGSFTSGSLTLANTGATETFSTAGTLSNNLNLTFSSATTGTNSVSVPLSNYPKLRSSVRFGGGFLEESNVSPIISGCRRRKVVVVEIPSRASLSNVGWKTIL